MFWLGGRFSYNILVESESNKVYLMYLGLFNVFKLHLF